MARVRSYGNQTLHELIDRRLVIDQLMAVQGAKTMPETQPVRAAAIDAPAPGWDSAPAPASDGTGGPDRRLPTPDSPLAAAFLATLREHGLRLPDQVDAMRAGVPVDLYYPDSDSAVVFVADRHAPPDLTALLFEGLDVVEVPADADPWDVITSRPDLFGHPGTRTTTPRSA